jgi:transcriptional regulator with XRE-family HTH domain
MSQSFGEIVRQERAQHGWDQAELAQRLGSVGQQAVSRWESGTSRPRRTVVAQIANLLDLDVNHLLTAAGYPAATADKPEEVQLPVRPLLATLPLDLLSPDDFEQFSADMAALLYPEASVSRNGAQGSRQDGVDVIVRHSAGKPTGIQCKREKQFGPAKVRKAVGELVMEVRECFIYLSRVATADARKEIRKHRGWELRDAKDLSGAVRNLADRDAAIRLVDTYFPGYRDPFLGVRVPGPWLTCGEFFRPESGDRIYSHRWALVGRSEQLTELTAFVASSDAPVAAIVGRGGIGKSRLLRELALRCEREQAARFRFVARSVDVQPLDFERLPPDDGLVIVIDDASDRSEITGVIDGVRRARPDAKIILSLRPQGLAQLAADLREAGIHPAALPRWELDDLSYVDAEALAQEVLGRDAHPALAARLARMAPDCPLLIVVGAALINRGLLNPTRLESGAPIRSEIMTAFRKAVTADPAEGSPEIRQEVLKGISVLQPFRLHEPAFQSALAALAGRALDQLMPHINRLEAAGVLVRRGTSLRILPDLLVDVVLAEACFDLPSGTPTGYLERVLASADGECLLNVFVNASRIDWQFSDVSGSLVTSMWPIIEKEFKAGDLAARFGLLKVLRKVAFFQPVHTIMLIRWAIDNLDQDTEDHESVAHPRYQRMVVEELPGVLGNVAYHADHLQEAADLLWELARHDSRPLNSNPGHPIRVLQNLVEYSAEKPTEFHELLLPAAEKWLHDPDVTKWPYSPFEVLKPLLATEGMDPIPDKLALRLRPYTVNAKAVCGLRDRVLDLAFAEAKHPDPKRGVEAVQAIGESLRYPLGMFNRVVSPEELQPWTPLFVGTIARLGELATDQDLDPVVIVAVREALWWHALYSTTPTRQAAQAVWERLPDSTQHRLAQVLHDGWGHFLPRGTDAMESERLREEKLQSVTAEAVATWTAPQLADQLEERLTRERLVFGRGGSARPFVWTLTHGRPSIAEEICGRTVERPDSVLRDLIPTALSQLAEIRGEIALRRARDLLAAHETVITCYVAEAFGLGLGARDTLSDGEADLLRSLLVDEDPRVRQATAIAAQRLGRRHRALATELVTSARFADSPDTAEEVAAAFGPHGFLSWDDLSDAQAQHVLRQLRECRSIDGYQITVLLAEISMKRPEDLLKLLMDRVELLESGERSQADYDPLPRSWHAPLGFKADSRYAQFLRTVRDWMAARPDSRARYGFGAEIFVAIAGNFDKQVTAIVLESAESSDKQQIKVAGALLRQAPPTLVWEVDFVSRALRAAARHGDECVQAIGAGLQATIITSSRPGRSGGLITGQTGDHDTATTIAAGLPSGSVEQNFYHSLSDWEDRLARMWDGAEDHLIDGRDW